MEADSAVTTEAPEAVATRAATTLDTEVSEGASSELADTFATSATLDTATSRPEAEPVCSVTVPGLTAEQLLQEDVSLLTPAEANTHITVWNTAELRKIAGNAAPLRRNLKRYLTRHPECEVFDGQDERLDPEQRLAATDNEHVPIWHRGEKRKVTGNAAPLRKNLGKYLARHPDCEVYCGQDRLEPADGSARAAASRAAPDVPHGLSIAAAEARRGRRSAAADEAYRAAAPVGGASSHRLAASRPMPVMPSETGTFGAGVYTSARPHVFNAAAAGAAFQNGNRQISLYYSGAPPEGASGNLEGAAASGPTTAGAGGTTAGNSAADLHPLSPATAHLYFNPYGSPPTDGSHVGSLGHYHHAMALAGTSAGQTSAHIRGIMSMHPTEASPHGGMSYDQTMAWTGDGGHSTGVPPGWLHPLSTVHGGSGAHAGRLSSSPREVAMMTGRTPDEWRGLSLSMSGTGAYFIGPTGAAQPAREPTREPAQRNEVMESRGADDGALLPPPSVLSRHMRAPAGESQAMSSAAAAADEVEAGAPEEATTAAAAAPSAKLPPLRWPTPSPASLSRTARRHPASGSLPPPGPSASGHAVGVGPVSAAEPAGSVLDPTWNMDFSPSEFLMLGMSPPVNSRYGMFAQSAADGATPENSTRESTPNDAVPRPPRNSTPLNIGHHPASRRADARNASAALHPG